MNYAALPIILIFKRWEVIERLYNLDDLPEITLLICGRSGIQTKKADPRIHALTTVLSYSLGLLGSATHLRGPGIMLLLQAGNIRGK